MDLIDAYFAEDLKVGWITLSQLQSMELQWQAVADKSLELLKRARRKGVAICAVVMIGSIYFSQGIGEGIVFFLLSGLICGAICAVRYFRLRGRTPLEQYHFLLRLIPALRKEMAADTKVALHVNIFGADGGETKPDLGKGRSEFMRFGGMLGNGKAFGFSLSFRKWIKGNPRKNKGFKQRSMLKVSLAGVQCPRASLADLPESVRAVFEKSDEAVSLWSAMGVRGTMLRFRSKKKELTRKTYFVPDSGYTADQILDLLRALTELGWANPR